MERKRWLYFGTVIATTTAFLAGAITGMCAESATEAEPVIFGISENRLDKGRFFQHERINPLLASADRAESGTTAQSLEFDDFEDEFEDEPDAAVFDPLRGYNRFMTGVNDKLYYWLFKPVSKGYSFVVPEPGRLAIGRCFKNLMFPVRLVNNLMQLKFKRAGVECARFGVNTTIGILGLGDPAQKWFNLEPCDEDFGQTLGRYGIGSGFHLVLPVIGPSNLRDAIGTVADTFLDPVFYLDHTRYIVAVEGTQTVNHTSLHGEEYESLKKDALDFYTFRRDVYEQNRKKELGE